MKQVERGFGGPNGDGEARRTALWYIVWYWLPVLLCAAAIFLASSRAYSPPPAAKSVIDGLRLDKGAHLLEYGCLGAFMLRALASLRSLTQGKVLALAFALPVLYAMTDEFHQSFVPGRHARLSDVGIDAIGIGAGLAIVQMGRHMQQRLGGDEAET